MISVVDMVLALIVPAALMAVLAMTWRVFYQRLRGARWRVKYGVAQMLLLAAAVTIGGSAQQVGIDRAIWLGSGSALVSYAGSWWLITRPYGLVGERRANQMKSLTNSLLAGLDANIHEDSLNPIEVMVVVALSAAAAAAVLRISDGDPILGTVAMGGTASVGLAVLLFRRHRRHMAIQSRRGSRRQRHEAGPRDLR